MKVRVVPTAALVLFVPLLTFCAEPVTRTSLPAPALRPPAPQQVSVAILDADVLADLPGDERLAIANSLDTLLTGQLSKESGLVFVNREALEKVLGEKAAAHGGLSKVAAADVAEELRGFWSAGVLICPTIRQLKPAKGEGAGKGSELIIEIDAVLAQTGQPLGEGHVIATWREHQWSKAPSLEAPLKALAGELPGRLRQALANRHIEIADVRLSSSLRRLQWMADDLGDVLRASLAQPGVALLRPRHPTSTKEERLLRVMGLSTAKGNDAAASLACSPDFRLDVELAEEVGNELDLEKTTITLKLSLQGRDGKPTTESLTGKASEYAALSRQASAWLNNQVRGATPAAAETRDQDYSGHLARRELQAAQQLAKVCGWYSNGWNISEQQQVLRSRVLERALRASHLDPTSEEAARLTVLGLDAPYWLRDDGRSSVCYDRVIAEGQRYLERFGKSKRAEEVREKIAGLAFQRLSEMRAGGEWTSLPFDPEVYRYAKVSLLFLERDIRQRIGMNLWAHASVIGGCIFMHCPEDRLAEERAYWKAYWKKHIEPVKGLDAPKWEFVDLYYFMRKKDIAGLRNQLSELARLYPRSHQYVWWGTRMMDNQPQWKVRVQRLLKEGGDPDWKTWEPSFGAATFDWNPYGYGAFLSRFNPPTPQAWDARDAQPLPADRITLEGDFLAAAGKDKSVRPLLAAGGSMWMCQPAPSEVKTTPSTLLLAPLERMLAEDKDPHAKAGTIAWPVHPDAAEAGTARNVRCWASTLEDKVPVVWIGTARHGVARFDFKDGKWAGRWYGSREGIPGEDTLLLRSCMHAGKRKLLILSQARDISPIEQQVEKFLWVLDPASGEVTLLAKSRRWYTLSYSIAKIATYQDLVAVCKDGTKIPLCVYNPDDYPKIDASAMKDLEHQGYDFMAVRGGDLQVWGWGGEGLSVVDRGMKAVRLLEGARVVDDVYFCSPEKGLHPLNVDQNGKTRFSLPASHGEPKWTTLHTPLVVPLATSGAPGVMWAAVGPRHQMHYGCIVLTAYKPAEKGVSEEQDRWYGPWRTEQAIQTLDFIEGHLWLVTADGALQRFKPGATLASAEGQKAARSTAAWRIAYRKAMESSSWVNAVRLKISGKDWDGALATIAAARQAPTAGTLPAAGASDFALWEALIRARSGDLVTADRLYGQLANDEKAEPFARGLAMVNLVNVRHAAKDWSGLEKAVDKLVATFPELNGPRPFSSADAIEWYRDQARKNSTTTKAAAAATGTSRPANKAPRGK